MNEEKMSLSRIEQLLEENLGLAEENNKLLRDLRRAARWGFWFRVLIWIVVLALPLLLILPLLNILIPSTGDSSVFGLPSAEQLQPLIDAWKAGQVENQI